MDWLLTAAATAIAWLVVSGVAQRFRRPTPDVALDAPQDEDITDAADAAPSRFFETRLSTHLPPWPRARWFLRWLRRLGDAIEDNQDYRPHWETLDKWWVEFPDGEDETWREIGFDDQGEAVLAGPSERNYGFWCDTNMTLSDFERQDPALIEVSANAFESAWKAYFATSPDRPIST